MNKANKFDTVQLPVSPLLLKKLRKEANGAPLPNRPVSIVYWGRQEIGELIPQLRNVDVKFVLQVDVQVAQLFSSHILFINCFYRI